MKDIGTALIIILLFSLWCSIAYSQNDLLIDAKRQYDKGNYNSAIGLYTDFLEKHPYSEKVMFAYNQIAGIYYDNLKDYQKSANIYQSVADNYPNTYEAKQALFMVAFIYDEKLKDKKMAYIKYKEFVGIYYNTNNPSNNDKMVESAIRMLEVLESGNSIEELIEKNKE